jgi:hypothetical protein
LTATALAQSRREERLQSAAPEQAGRTEVILETPFVPATQRPAPSLPDEIHSTIAELNERRPNEYVITLANGQVWSQSLAKRYPLRTGQPVRIYSTRWGDSYRLTAIESKGYIQVERLPGTKD